MGSSAVLLWWRRGIWWFRSERGVFFDEEMTMAFSFFDFFDFFDLCVCDGLWKDSVLVWDIYFLCIMSTGLVNRQTERCGN